MGRFIAAFAIVSALAAPASAEILRLSAELQTGGMYGHGTDGDQASSAFFAKSPHFTYGANLAAELFFFDAWIQHQQFTEFSGTLTTWTQFGLGVHFQFDQGTEQEKKLHNGNTFYEVGFGVFFGLGTPIQVKPPLDNSQLSDKGFLFEGRFGFGKHLNKVFDILVSVPASYGYFFRETCAMPPCAANDLSTNYRSWQIEALVALRGTLRLL